MVQKYILGERLRTKLISECGSNGREFWLAYIRECEETPDEQTIAIIKRDIESTTILSTVGFRKDSISQYELLLSAKNGTIEPVASRVSEHDLCIKMLTAIAEAAPHLTRGRTPRGAARGRTEGTC
jgi:hypothetical protein